MTNLREAAGYLLAVNSVDKALYCILAAVIGAAGYLSYITSSICVDVDYFCVVIAGL